MLQRNKMPATVDLHPSKFAVASPVVASRQGFLSDKCHNETTSTAAYTRTRGCSAEVWVKFSLTSIEAKPLVWQVFDQLLLPSFLGKNSSDRTIQYLFWEKTTVYSLPLKKEKTPIHVFEKSSSLTHPTSLALGCGGCWAVTEAGGHDVRLCVSFQALHYWPGEEASRP